MNKKGYDKLPWLFEFLRMPLLSFYIKESSGLNKKYDSKGC